MIKKYFFILFIPSVLYAQSAKDIILKVDQNDQFTTEEFSAVMRITKGKKELVKEFTGYGSNNGEKSFIKFINSEDRDVKYLKIKKELWIYFPDADDVMKISGHMLRQGMMGSDISYEDMLESSERDKKYTSKLSGEEETDGRPCYVIELSAKTEDAPYERQVLYIDKELYVGLRMEMYARGGRLIKKMTASEHIKIAGKNVPRKISIQDMRKKNSVTVVEFKKIIFNGQIPANIFTRQMLKK